MATAPELYDVAAQIVKSVAQAGISSATRVYAFGSCPIGDLNTVVPVTSMSEAAEKREVETSHKYYDFIF